MVTGTQSTVGPFSETHSVKRGRFIHELRGLTLWHQEHCKEYAKILSATHQFGKDHSDLADFPMLPVRIFKEMDLFSVPRPSIVKTLTSSGTTGQRPSRIHLDTNTSTEQARALSQILTSFLGTKRLPMAIIESEAFLKDRALIGARAAGVIGFTQFGREHTYLLDEQLDLKCDKFEQFAEKYKGQNVLFFGFTSIVWEHFYQAAARAQRKFDFGNSILIHGGGWKKMQEHRVSPQEFSARLREQFGISRVYDYYGMVEQTGSIFMGCEHGRFHASCFSDVLVRSPRTLEVLPFGVTGLLEVFSLIQHSYPGHILLTEDLGTIIGEDDCPCGRMGKTFTVQGRLPQSELRGCSDARDGRIA